MPLRIYDLYRRADCLENRAIELVSLGKDREADSCLAEADSLRELAYIRERAGSEVYA